MHWKINGRRIAVGNTTAVLDAMQQVLIQKARDHLHARLSRIRHPETGEVPTIVVEGDKLEDLRVRIEGTTDLLRIVCLTLSPEERERYLPNLPATSAPKVFLGFGSEDEAVSDRLAAAFHAAGVEIVFYAPWDLNDGDSIPAEISAGLDACTHFISLWTPHSRAKPWVLQEVYAAFMRRVRGDVRFTLLRYRTEVSSLPSIMSHLLSPELRDEHFDADVAKLIRDVQGVSRRPEPVMTAPPIILDERYTAAALTVARQFVDASQTGRWGDPSFDGTELQARTGLSAIEIEDATHELGAFLHSAFPGHFDAKDEIFVEFDARWQSWNPATDALRIAADLVNGNKVSTATEALLTQYDWPVRRVNPAVTYLTMRKLVWASQAISDPMVTSWIRTTPDTRRFVQSRSGM